MTIDEMRTGLADMLLSLKNIQETFKKETYPMEFEYRYRECCAFMEQLHREFSLTDDVKGLTFALADAPAAAAKKVLSEIKGRNKRETRMMEFNLNMVAFVNSVLLMYPSEYFDNLVIEITQAWGEAFPKFKIQKADYSMIATGFKRKYCYITTAVCQSRGLSDDCYELTLLRNYRDDYLASTDVGQAIIDEYYNIAPTIVTRINESDDSSKVYSGLYDNYISKCIGMIEKNELAKCCRTYKQMVEALKEKYLYQ